MKDFIIYSEHLKAGVYPPLARDLIDEINFRVHEDGKGTDFEFMLKFEKLGNGTALRLEIFDDAFKAFTACPEVFNVIAGHHHDFRQKPKELPPDILEQIAKGLQLLGWKRKAPPPAQEKKRRPVCPTCGHAGEACLGG